MLPLSFRVSHYIAAFTCLALGEKNTKPKTSLSRRTVLHGPARVLIRTEGIHSRPGTSLQEDSNTGEAPLLLGSAAPSFKALFGSESETS